MNHDDKNLPPSNPNSASAAEMEARIVAWVAGEASAFEIAELERLVAAQPELAIFKRRIEAVHGLVAEAARPEAASLRLAPERRAKLLATIGAGEAASASAENAGAKPMTLPLLGSRQKGWRTQAWVAAGTAVAACLVVGVIVLENRVTFGGSAEQARMLPLIEADKKRAAEAKQRQESPRDEAVTLSVAMPVVMDLAPPSLAPQAKDRISNISIDDPRTDFPTASGVVLNERAVTFTPLSPPVTSAAPVTTADRSVLVWGGGNFNIAADQAFNFQTPVGGSVLNKVGQGVSGPVSSPLSSELTSGSRTFVLADDSVRVTGGGGAKINTQGLQSSTLSETSDFAFTTGGSFGTKDGGQGAKPTQTASGSLGAWSGAITLNNVVSLNGGVVVSAPSNNHGSVNLAGTGGQTMVGGNLAVINQNGAVSQSRTLTVGGAGPAPVVVNLTSENRAVAVVESNTLNLRSVAVPAGGNGTLTFRDVAGGIIDTGLGGVRASPPGGQAGVATPQSPVAPSDIVKLDAFVVSAPRDSSYAAASSLAGSRFSFGGPVGGVLNSGPSVGAAQKTAAGRGGFAARPSRFGSDGIPSGGSDLAFLRGDVDSVAAPPPPAAVAFDDKQVIRLDAFTVSTEGRARSAPDAEIAAKKKEEDKPVVRPAAQRVEPPADAEVRAAQEGVSTFSLHVGEVSFRLAQAALARDELPDPARIRPEEFYNALDYGDPAPTAAEKVTARIEQAAHPVLQQRNLVRVAVKVAATGRGPGTPLRLTVLLDTSGSMERDDRAATVRRALGSLASLLGPADRVTLIGFARTPRLLAEAVPGDQARSLVRIAAGVPAEGGTNLEEALKLAAELARRHRAEGALNRIVLLTDGAANLGDAVPARLAAVIEGLRRERIALDACGIGLDGLDDEILEALTRHGDGRYTVLNTPEDADAGFAKKLAGAFRPAAENVKLQVRFNPARVGAWRLVGFEQHRMKAEDFRNDAVDAAELAAEEAAVALYQVEVLPQGEGEIGEVFVRFRDPTGGAAIERSWPIAHEARAPAFTRAAPTLKLAATAALLAEKLRGGTLASQFKLGELEPTVTVLRTHYVGVPRVEELAAMFAQARRLTRE